MGSNKNSFRFDGEDIAPLSVPECTAPADFIFMCFYFSTLNDSLVGLYR